MQGDGVRRVTRSASVDARSDVALVHPLHALHASASAADGDSSEKK